MLDRANHTDIESPTPSLKHFCFFLFREDGEFEREKAKKKKMQLGLFQFVCVRITSPKKVPFSSHAKANN